MFAVTGLRGRRRRAWLAAGWVTAVAVGAGLGVVRAEDDESAHARDESLVRRIVAPAESVMVSWTVHTCGQMPTCPYELWVRRADGVVVGPFNPRSVEAVIGLADAASARARAYEDDRARPR